MLEEDDRRRAGQVVGSLLDRQNQMGAGEDPFSLMKQLTETFNQPSGPINTNSWATGGGSYSNACTALTNRNKSSNPLGLNMSSYAAFQKQVISQSQFAGTLDQTQGLSSLKLSARRRDDQERSQSPMEGISGLQAKKLLASLGPLAEFKVGGVSMMHIGMKEASTIVKNKEIFDRAQRREKSVDWNKLQQSKDACIDAQKGKLPPMLAPGEFQDPTGAFDRMISSKKEARDNSMTTKKAMSGQIKLSKQQEVQIGLEMIPMYQAKEEELIVQHKKLQGLRQEIEGYMQEHNVGKVRYAQPQHVTSFMNRKIPLPKKQSVAAEDMPVADVSDDRVLNADLDFEKMQSSVRTADQKTPRERVRQQIEQKTNSSRKKPGDYEPLYREFEKRNDSNQQWPPQVPTTADSFRNEVRNGASLNNNAKIGSGRQHYNTKSTTTVQKWNQTQQLQPLKSGSVASQRSSLLRSKNNDQQQTNKTRSQTMTNQPKFIDGNSHAGKSNINMKSSGIVEPIHSGSMNLQPLARRKNSTTIAGKTEKKNSGILEERGESTCSSKDAPRINSDDGGDESILYPELRNKSKLSQTRNSCHIIESSQMKNIQLERADKLKIQQDMTKMQPVQTAFAKLRSRKNNELDSLCYTSKTKHNQASTMNTNINDSQKRIRAILDKKHNQDRACVATAGSSEFDVNGTQRDLKSLEEPHQNGQQTEVKGQKGSQQHYDREQREQIALEVTDRLYNKKQIKKL